MSILWFDPQCEQDETGERREVIKQLRSKIKGHEVFHFVLWGDEDLRCLLEACEKVSRRKTWKEMEAERYRDVLNEVESRFVR